MSSPSCCIGPPLSVSFKSTSVTDTNTGKSVSVAETFVLSIVINFLYAQELEEGLNHASIVIWSVISNAVASGMDT